MTYKHFGYGTAWFFFALGLYALVTGETAAALAIFSMMMLFIYIGFVLDLAARVKKLEDVNDRVNQIEDYLRKQRE